MHEAQAAHAIVDELACDTFFFVADFSEHVAALQSVTLCTIGDAPLVSAGASSSSASGALATRRLPNGDS
jgi:hypothetical protein